MCQIDAFCSLETQQELYTLSHLIPSFRLMDWTLELFSYQLIFSIGFFVYCFSLKLTKGVWQWFNLSPHKEGHRLYSCNVKPL